jgi:hypothetical protein
MPTSTYVSLATQSLTSTASSVTFSSIPATYRDLVLVHVGATSAEDQIRIRFNSDTGSNYSFVQMGGDSGGSFSTSGTLDGARISFGSTGINSTIVHIMDYSASDKHTTLLSRANKAAGDVRAHAARWANTAVVTTVTFYPITGTFSSGSTFSLYGIAA